MGILACLLLYLSSFIFCKKMLEKRSKITPMVRVSTYGLVTAGLACLISVSFVAQEHMTLNPCVYDCCGVTGQIKQHVK